MVDLTIQQKTLVVSCLADRLGDILNKADRLRRMKGAIDDEAYKQELHQWIQDEKHATRLAVNKFIATAVNYKAGGSASEEEVKVLLAALDEDNVLERENYQIYPIVKWVRKHLK